MADMLEVGKDQGMEFATENSELIHLTRARSAPITTVQLGQQEI
jgi:hypothetical protein